MDIIWDDNLYTGVEELDEQHYRLFAMVDKLRAGDFEKNQILDLLVETREYMVEHFAAEDKYMYKMGYPDYEIHKNYHKKIMKDYNGLMLRLAEDKTLDEMMVDLRTIFDNWVNHHYKVQDDADLKLAAFIRNHLKLISKE